MAVSLIARWLPPAVILGISWWILTKGEPGSWVVGLPAVVLAMSAYGRLHSRSHARIRVLELPGFAAWFLWHSLRGGADVAGRALRPRMSLNPGFLPYRLTLPPGPERVFLVNCVSLLPGTLSADIRGDELVLHALDTGTDIVAQTHAVERRVKRLFGLKEATGHG